MFSPIYVLLEEYELCFLVELNCGREKFFLHTVPDLFNDVVFRNPFLNHFLYIRPSPGRIANDKSKYTSMHDILCPLQASCIVCKPGCIETMNVIFSNMP